LNNKKKYTLLICLLLLVSAAKVAEHLSFFYFNPDSHQSNLSQLKSDMDSALIHNQQKFSFQPFARLDDFNKQLRSQRPSLLYIPHWYLDRFGKELGLRPLLHSLRENKTTYRKQLITNIRSNKKIHELENGSLAMTTMGPDSRSILNSVIFSQHKIRAEKLSIVEVPKDADAVFAVALGQVDSALVSETSLQLLKLRNPRLTASVHVIADTKPITLPVLCYLEGTFTEKELDTLRKQLSKPSPQKGKSIFNILNIDTWRPQI